MQSIQIPFNEHYFDEQGQSGIFNGQGRVFKCLLDNEPVYVKKSEKSKRRIGHKMQSVLYKIFKDPILIPTVLGKGEDDIRFQVDKMRRLKQNGIRVPEVIYVCSDYFIMADGGECVKDYLKKHPEQTDSVLARSCCEMAKLHMKNFVHGGAQIKNFVIKNGVVSLIDFEEKILPEHVEAFKVRDMLVFLLSLERCRFHADIKRLCRLYEQMTAVDMYGEIKRFFKKYRWLSFLNGRLFRFLRMNDVRAFLNLMKRFDA